MHEGDHGRLSDQGRQGLVLRRFILRLCVALTLAAALLLAGEAITYNLNRHRGGGADKYEYRAFVVWRVSHPQSNIITLDSDGLRRTLYTHCGLNVFTIWMFGGSGLWGHYNGDNETIPSLLAKRFADSGRQVCVKNYGQRGWASTQEVIELMLELKRARKKPDLVVFYDGTVDAILPFYSDQPDVHLGFATAKEKFEGTASGELAGFEYLRATNTYLLLKWIGDRLGLNDPDNTRSISSERAASMAQYTLSNYSANMEIVDTFSAHYGFRYAFFWEPWVGTADKPLTATEASFRNGEQKHNPGGTKVMAATYQLFSAVSRPHLVYLGDILKGRKETFFLDGSHLTGEGHRLVAEKIYQMLQNPGQ